MAGAAILTEDGGPVTFLRVIHSGAVDIIHDGRLLDLLGTGDTFGHAAMLSGLPPGFEARARRGHPVLPDPGQRGAPAAATGSSSASSRSARPVPAAGR